MMLSLAMPNVNDQKIEVLSARLRELVELHENLGFEKDALDSFEPEVELLSIKQQAVLCEIDLLKERIEDLKGIKKQSSILDWHNASIDLFKSVYPSSDKDSEEYFQDKKEFESLLGRMQRYLSNLL